MKVLEKRRTFNRDLPVCRLGRATNYHQLRLTLRW